MYIVVDEHRSIHGIHPDRQCRAVVDECFRRIGFIVREINAHLRDEQSHVDGQLRSVADSSHHDEHSQSSVHRQCSARSRSFFQIIDFYSSKRNVSIGTDHRTLFAEQSNIYSRKIRSLLPSFIVRFSLWKRIERNSYYLDVSSTFSSKRCSTAIRVPIAICS